MSELTVDEHENERMKDAASPIKHKSILKLTLQYVGFVIFMIFGLGQIFENFVPGLGIIIAGSLLLPTIQSYLLKTPVNSNSRIAFLIFFIILLVLVLGAPPSTSDNTTILRNQEKIKKAAEENFSENREKVINEIKQFEGKDWAVVKSKTWDLLGTQDPEILRLHNLATEELAKQEEEINKQQQKLLAEEFKEKKLSLIKQIKIEVAKGNYSLASSIGSNYISVADDEFKKIHESAAEKQAIESSAAPWVYSKNDDPMSKGKTYLATLESSNTVQFGFPYSGEQHGTLTLRTDPKYGKDVIFSVERGQILCTSYDGCIIKVRFDDGDALSFSAAESSDHSTEIIFIRNYGRFVEKMMKSKRVRISMNFYQEGAPVFDFDVSGFNITKYKQE